MYADEGDFIDPDDIDRNSQGFIMALSRQLENEPFSRFAAEECCKEMAKYGLKNLGVKVGTVFTVLYYSECPSIIVEMGYVTNKDDYAYLTSKNAKKEMATAITNAIVTYFTTLYGAVESSQETTEESAEEAKSEEVKSAEGEILAEGYSIQLISSATEVDTSDYQFKEYKGRVRLIMGEGKYKYKYCYGSYKTSADATEDLGAVRKVFKDAYVVRYKDGAIQVK
jgi:N-acetylmuramoyl-L-alanine amidase